LGAIIQNVSSSVFCEVKRNKKCIENRFLIIPKEFTGSFKKTLLHLQCRLFFN